MEEYSIVTKERNPYAFLNIKTVRNTQKQLKITSYGRNESFKQIYLVYNGAYLKLLGSLL